MSVTRSFRIDNLSFDYVAIRLTPPSINVEIDIKPGSDPNSINLDSEGVIPVAILTTSVEDGDSIDFDAADVDQTTLTLAGAAAREKSKSGKIG